MSKSLKTTFLLTFMLQILRGQNGYQNLVVNPSFEQRILTVTPHTEDGIDSIEEFVGWTSPTHNPLFYGTPFELNPKQLTHFH